MSSKKIKKPITDKNLLSDWDYEKNNGLRPEHFSAGSGKRVWWKCHICGYAWNTTIGNRALSKRGCPACSKSGGHVVLKDIMTYLL